jgi:hypothetical protein
MYRTFFKIRIQPRKKTESVRIRIHNTAIFWTKRIYNVHYVFYFREMNDELVSAGFSSICHTFDVWHMVKVSSYLSYTFLHFSAFSDATGEC